MGKLNELLRTKRKEPSVDSEKGIDVLLKWQDDVLIRKNGLLNTHWLQEKIEKENGISQTVYSPHPWGVLPLGAQLHRFSIPEIKCGNAQLCVDVTNTVAPLPIGVTLGTGNTSLLFASPREFPIDIGGLHVPDENSDNKDFSRYFESRVRTAGAIPFDRNVSDVWTEQWEEGSCLAFFPQGEEDPKKAIRYWTVREFVVPIMSRRGEFIRIPYYSFVGPGELQPQERINLSNVVEVFSTHSSPPLHSSHCP